MAKIYVSDETVKSLAEEYANTLKPMSTIANENGISITAFRESMRKAIVERLVDYPTALRIRDKSIANQHQHSSKAQTAQAYYKELFEQRTEYFKMFFNYGSSSIIAEKYMFPGETVGSVARYLKYSPHEAFYTILKGAIFSFDTEVYNKFIDKIRYEFRKDPNLDDKINKISMCRGDYIALLAKLNHAKNELETIDEQEASEDEDRRSSLASVISQCENEITWLKLCAW